MATKMSSKYKSCPLKKRPIVYFKEDEPENLPKIVELPKPICHYVEEEQPQDLSLKRKASQNFEDIRLPAKRECVLNLSASAVRQSEATSSYYRPESPAISVASDLSATSSTILSPKVEFDSSMEYHHSADLHLRGLTPVTTAYTTNPYQSAFVMAAGCNPMTALWHTYQVGGNTTIYPSSPSTIGSNNFYSNSGSSQLMLMTPPSSPGSDASSSSEPEDLSVRNDIPLPALFHLFDEAPTVSATLASTNSSGYSAISSSAGSSGSSTAMKHYRFKCENCSKMYSTSMGLSKHQQFHCPAAECNQEKKQHACKDCGKLYTTIGALKMHIRTHTLPCKCPICGKAFSRPWLLQGHIRTHTGEKPFQCPDCPRSFADRSNLRAHQQTHVDIKKYACKVCHKSFSRMSLLNKHANSNCTITIA